MPTSQSHLFNTTVTRVRVTAMLVPTTKPRLPTMTSTHLMSRTPVSVPMSRRSSRAALRRTQRTLRLARMSARCMWSTRVPTLPPVPMSALCTPRTRERTLHLAPTYLPRRSVSRVQTRRPVLTQSFVVHHGTDSGSGSDTSTQHVLASTTDSATGTDTSKVIHKTTDSAYWF